MFLPLSSGSLLNVVTTFCYANANLIANQIICGGGAFEGRSPHSKNSAFSGSSFLRAEISCKPWP